MMGYNDEAQALYWVRMTKSCGEERQWKSGRSVGAGQGPSLVGVWT